MVERQNIKLNHDPSRVLLQFFSPGSEERSKKIINRIINLNEKDIDIILQKVLNDFKNRHRNLKDFLLQSYNNVSSLVENSKSISQKRMMLIGAYFVKEYSVEAAALFNPSIVIHPDQSNLNKGEVRFILSLRATGEGHISSLEFRTGVVNRKGKIVLNEPSKFVTAGQIKNDSNNEPDYEIWFDNNIPLDERILFPYSKSESNGIEDARFVRFHNSGNDYTFYATYTAYDGKSISINLIETKDFASFKIKPLKGKAAKNKGMALFPEKVNGKYAMISRIDGENLFFSQSDNIQVWDEVQLLKAPEQPWEFVQIGNCGSPVKTEKGWVLLTHGVGPVRSYVVSAILLNPDNPSQIMGYLQEPLISPDNEEREGYVPNVVYTCGAIINNNIMIIPYAQSDQSAGFVTVPVEKLFEKFIYQ